MKDAVGDIKAPPRNLTALRESVPQPKLIDPTAEETKFSDLPATEQGDYLASQDLATAVYAQQFARKDLAQAGSRADVTDAASRLKAAQDAQDDANSRLATWAQRIARPVQSYPTLAKAMLDTPQLTEADVKRVVNFTAAWTAADAISQADPTGQMNILLSLPDTQRSVVMDILDEQRKAAVEAANEADAADAAERKTWGPLRTVTQGIAGDMLGGVDAAVQGVYGTIAHGLRAIKAGTDYRNSLPIGQQGQGNPVTDLFFFWDSTAPGTYNSQIIDSARAEYGSVGVDLILEIQRAKDEGDPNPINTIAGKYWNDPERAPILRSLTQRVWDSPEREAEASKWLSLADKLLSAQTSDLGAMITTTDPITGNPVPLDAWWRASTPQTVLAKGVNVAATFATDPLIIGSKVRGIMVASKYGLEKLAIDAGVEGVTATGASAEALSAANMAAISKAVRQPRVWNALESVTADIAKYRAIKDAGEDASRFAAKMAQRWKTYFPEDVLIDMADKGVTSPQLFVKYVTDSNNVLRLERGEAALMDLSPDAIDRKIAEIESKSVYGRLARQQPARRGNPLLPNQAAAIAAGGASILPVAQFRRSLSSAISRMNPDAAAKAEVKAFYTDANDPNVPIAAILFNDPAAAVAFDSKISGPWDKLKRWVATTPGKDAIYTADARDTKVFEKFSRLFVSKAHAEYLAEAWRTGTQSQRILLWVGMVRSAANKVGAPEIADQMRFLGTRLVANKNELTVKEIMDSMTFAHDPRNLFAAESATIDLGDGAKHSLDDVIEQWAKDQHGSAELTDSQIAEFKQSLLSTDPTMKALLNHAVTSSPSNFDGSQMALHLWQTSDYLAVPTMSDISLITKRAKLLQAVTGMTPGSALNNVVNWWSMLNLVGFRYSMRNAIEDWTLYALTGGYFMDAVKGRALTTGTREARGQKIGIIARKMRKAGGVASSDPESYSVWQNIVLPHLDPAEVAAAHKAAENGQLGQLRSLVVNAVVRQKIGRLLSAEEKRWVSEYVMSDAQFIALDEVTELAKHLNLGTMPDSMFSGIKGIRVHEGTVVHPRSDWVSYEFTKANAQQYATYWHRGLEGVLARDGAIGKAAVANLDNLDDAIRAVAEAIESDTKYKYRERLAAFYEKNVSSQEFARRYVQDVYNMFSKKDGSFNRELWSKFVYQTDDGRKVSWATKGRGNWKPRVTVQDLQNLDPADMPKALLGKRLEAEPLIIPQRVSEKIWNAMGSAYSRIAREPIYFGNYIRARKGLTAYERQMANVVGDAAASNAATRIAQDRALALTLQFTDNPANQSMLAWRMRNYARYYRATEDFYRRVYRMAKFHPIGIYKAWLTLNVLDDNGFIYTDSYGDKYFMYPGDGIVNNLMARVLSGGGNSSDGIYTDATPLTFGGKVKMLAPSFDPNAAMPMLGSPLAAFSVKLVTNFVPQFQQYEKYVLGVYSADQPMLQSMAPAPFVRALGLLNHDERNSAYASAYMSAAQVAEGAGLLPQQGATEAEIAASQNGLAGLADQILKLRFALGFVYPASPQIMQNDVTDYARRYGIDNLTSVYRGLLQEEFDNGSPDPYNSALMKGVSIYGLGFTAYAVGKSGPGKGMKGIPEYSYSQDVTKFAQDNSDLIADHPSASMFLAPIRDGSYDPAARKWLIQQGYKTEPSISEYMDRLNMAEAQYVYQATMDDADAEIAAATNDLELAAAEDAKRRDKVAVYAKYPDLSQWQKKNIEAGTTNRTALLNDVVDATGTVTRKSEVRSMIDDFYNGKYGSSIPKSVEKIAEAIATYDEFTADSKQITGNSEADREAKKQNQLKLLANLQLTAADDPHAAMFIRKVLYPLLKADANGNPRD